jgi:Transglycosylase SLT domain
LFKSIIILCMSLLIGGECWLHQPVEIPKIEAHPYTEQYLRSEFEWEQKQKEIAHQVEISAHIYRNYNCSAILAGPTAQYASLHHLPVSLVTAVVIIESSCHSDATNRKSGATGLMQVMPGMHGASRKALLNRETNIAVGTKLLGTLVHDHGMEEGVASYFGITPGSDAAWDYADRVFKVAKFRR